MLRNTARALLIALTLQYVLPLFFSGFQFHGSFLSALGLAAVYTISYLLAGAFAGLALESFTASEPDAPKLVPLWVVLFWGLSSLLLLLTPHVAPSLLTLSGWLPTLGGGLILLLVGMLTGRRTRSTALCRSNNCKTRNEPTGSTPRMRADEEGESGGTPASSTGASSPPASPTPISSGCGKGKCSCSKKGCSRCSGKSL